MVVRVFSMSAGLAASMVTPGSTPPDASWTCPEMLAWAAARLGKATTARPMRKILDTSRHICALLGRSLDGYSVRFSSPTCVRLRDETTPCGMEPAILATEGMAARAPNCGSLSHLAPETPPLQTVG